MFERISGLPGFFPAWDGEAWGVAWGVVWDVAPCEPPDVDAPPERPGVARPGDAAKESAPDAMKASPAAAAIPTMRCGWNKDSLRAIPGETGDYENATATTATALQKVAGKGHRGKGF
jgi:hypothetical protein